MGVQADVCRTGGDGDGGAAATTGGGMVLELEVVVVGVEVGLALGRVAIRAVLLLVGCLLSVKEGRLLMVGARG